MGDPFEISADLGGSLWLIGDEVMGGIQSLGKPASPSPLRKNYFYQLWSKIWLAIFGWYSHKHSGKYIYKLLKQYNAKP
jgi:hypothetical protein